MRTDHDLPSDQRVAIRKARKKIAIGVSIVLPGASGVIIPYRLFIVLTGSSSWLVDSSKHQAPRCALFVGGVFSRERPDVAAAEPSGRSGEMHVRRNRSVGDRIKVRC